MLTIPVTLDNDNLPATGSIRERILAAPSLLDWFQMDPAHATFTNGKVTQFNGLKGARTLSQADAALRAPLIENGIGSYPALDNGDSPFAYGLSGSYSLAGAWTWAFVMLEKAGDNQWAAGTFQSSTAQTGISKQGSGGVFGFRNAVEVGAGAIELGSGLDVWRLIIVGATAGGTLKAEVNGVRLADDASSDTMASGTFAIGTLGPSSDDLPWLGGFSDVMLFTDDLFANDTGTLEAIRELARQVYGLSIA